MTARTPPPWRLGAWAERLALLALLRNIGRRLPRRLLRRGGRASHHQLQFLLSSEPFDNFLFVSDTALFLTAIFPRAIPGAIPGAISDTAIFSSSIPRLRHYAASRAAKQSWS